MLLSEHSSLSLSHSLNTLIDLLKAKSYLEQQSHKYQKYDNRRRELEREIKYHQNMIAYHTIPKKFKPPAIPTTVKSNAGLTDEFTETFKKVFFAHLDKVVTGNKVDLQLTEEAMEEVVAQMEAYLCTLEIPPPVKASLHHEFLTSNHITNHNPSPTLLKKLPTKTDPRNHTQSTTPNILGKRKLNDQHQPTSVKKVKHFLSQGSQQPPAPP